MKSKFFKIGRLNWFITATKNNRKSTKGRRIQIIFCKETKKYKFIKHSF